MYGAIGRGVGASPAGDFFPLSGATASSPTIIITATTATGGGTIVHTADLNAQDVPIVYVANNSAATLVAYLQMGTLATTQSIPTSVTAGTWTIVTPGTPISKSGVVGIWTTATTGLVAYGGVNRTYTATA